ncbi:hypothetical protein BOX15_Mlig008148g1 [Macrostomum lignano]|uniref:Inositol oxygenase n=2 Tax=Macrostomum lignano TaxID=282301 RepID=A0A267DZ48_9PLAT|nr:hypothetical protein BOX15_Mlig008148g1 [Macrostomum lignano]
MAELDVELPPEVPQAHLVLIDPSEFRPEHRDVQLFRNYIDSPLQERVERTYRAMHTGQTVQFVQDRLAHWGKFDHARLSMLQVIKALDNLVDEADPDTDLPNSMHAFQTAERIRERHPDKEWLILTGLIHDTGKILRLYGEEMWATVGDTYPVGCAPRNSIVFGKSSFSGNPDLSHPVYSTELGMYSRHCGLDALTMSWGHDEYLYRVLQHNGHKLPEAALSIIRYHSFYPWHSGGDYRDFHNPATDDEKLKWVQAFSQFDLYSKSEELPDVQALLPYYSGLIDKYLPSVLSW